MVMVLAAECLVAYLVLDLLLLALPVGAANLRRVVRWFGFAYAVVAAGIGAVGTWVSWAAAGPKALWVTGWTLLLCSLLWRFGLRKQLPELFNAEAKKTK